VEQTPESSGTLGFRHGLEPAPEECLAFGVGEVVRAQQRILDDFERLLSPRRRVATDIAQIRRDLVVRLTIDMATANAINAFANGDITITSSGNIATSGISSRGITARSEHGAVTLRSESNIETGGACVLMN